MEIEYEEKELRVKITFHISLMLVDVSRESQISA
jgi:hypothetical protein